METTNIKAELIGFMNSLSTEFEYQSNPDRTVRKSDGKFSNSNWDSATEIIKTLVQEGVNYEQAKHQIATMYLKDSSKLFDTLDAAANSTSGRNLLRKKIRYTKDLLVTNFSQEESGTIPAGTEGIVIVDQNDVFTVLFTLKPEGLKSNYVSHVNVKNSKFMKLFVDSLEILN
jgi:hypothetical protein